MVFLWNTFANGFDLGKCFFSILKKQFSNVGFYIHRKGWIKPYDLPSSLLFFFLPSFFLTIFVFMFQFFIKTPAAWWFL